MGTWKQQVSVLWWCQLLAIAAMEMSEPFWPLFLRQLSPDSENIVIWSALIYGAPLLVSGLVAPYWGMLGDRYGHKKMVLRASFGLAITQGLLYFSSSLWEVLAYRLLQGALAGIITAVLCFANSMAPQQNRSAVIGQLTSATAAGAIFGPLLGGILIQWLSFAALFGVASITCLMITFVLMYRVSSGNPVIKELSPILPEKADRLLLSSRYTQLVGLFLFVIFLLQIAKAIPSSFFALYTEEYLIAKPFLTGLLFSAAGVGMMFSAPYWGKYFERLRRGSQPALLAFIAGIASLCYLLHLQADWLTLLIIRLIWGICLGAMLPMVQALIISMTEQRQQGLLIGRAQRTIKLGNLAGVGTGALILTVWDYQIGFSVAAAIYLLSALVLLLAWDKLNHRYLQKTSAEH